MAIALHIEGRGAPVIFFHGTPTPPTVLENVAHAVATSRTAVQVAFPGYGDSPELADGWTYGDMYAAIETALLERGFREIAIVGFSAGAYHALAIALRGNLAVKQIISLGGFAGLHAAERAAKAAVAEPIAAGVDLTSAVHPTFFSEAWRQRPESLVATRACLTATSPKNLAAELRRFGTMEDLLPRVGLLDIPILARHGTADESVPPKQSEEIVAAARNGRLEWVPGAGHALPIEDAEGTLASVLRALG